MCVPGIELRQVVRLVCKCLYPLSRLLIPLDILLKKSRTGTGAGSLEEVRARPMVDHELVINTSHVTTLTG